MDNLEPILFGSNIFAPDIEPDIILCDSFENEFFANFDKDSYPNTRIQKVEEFCCAEAALMQAHSVFDKNEFFSEEMILDRDVYFGVSEQKVVNLKFKTLPYRKIIRVYNTEKFFIYDDPTEMIIINFRGDTDYIVTIDIDGNGIFTLKYDETSSEGRQNNGKWFEKFIRGQNNPQTYTLPETTPTFDRIIKAVGFDFGTSKCCVATSKRDGIEVVAVENTGGRIMPSYVAFDEKHTKCGQIVVDRLPYKAAYSVFDLKRIIGKEYEFIVPYPDWPFRVLKSGSDVKIECNTWDEMQQQSPEEILSVLLRHIKVKTEEFQGDNVEEVVITVPGTFTQRQINSTFEAACQAGWKNISFLPEPIAALFTYFKKYPPNNFTGCVFDLGGGNLNVWIFKVENGKIVLLNNDGDTCLGGRNFDKALFTYLYARLKRQFNIDMTETKKYKLIKDCLDIKHSLSTQNKHTNVTKIFYVGGASRMPIIIEMLRGMFPECDHICDTCPDEIVAIGAAHYSYYLKDDNINKIEMEEVFSVLSYD
uniref:Uncharacterized protein n=1 Tax=Panagrolaimus davidi TaxID=227884 RepID=A0A914PVS4_9BILA